MFNSSEIHRFSTRANIKNLEIAIRHVGMQTKIVRHYLMSLLKLKYKPNHNRRKSLNSLANRALRKHCIYHFFQLI